MPRKPPVGKSLAEVNPELAKEWDPSKNGDLSPYDFSKSSNQKIWWVCSKNKEHVWDASISGRNYGGHGCAYCSGKKVLISESLCALNPQLAAEWHPTLNTTGPDEISPNSNKKVWWKCPNGDDHIYETTVHNRFGNGSKCGICYGSIVVNSNCLRQHIQNSLYNGIRL